MASKAEAGSIQTPNLPPIAVLAGMHVISREIDSWTWNTYWWEPQPYRNGTQFSDGRPALRGAWNNYVMNATLNEAGYPVNGQPRNAVYSPYQEIALPAEASQYNGVYLGGLASNCLGCHRNASYNYDGTIGLGVFTPGSVPQPDFSGKERIGFLWSHSKHTDALLTLSKPPQPRYHGVTQILPDMRAVPRK